MESGIKKEYFSKLAEKLEEQFEKGEKCECGKRLEARSHALTLNAYANIYLEDALTEQLKQVENIIDEYCGHVDACYGGDNLAETIKDRLKKL